MECGRETAILADQLKVNQLLFLFAIFQVQPFYDVTEPALAIR